MSDERVEDRAGAATRRGLLVGAGAAGAAAVLAACGTDDGDNPYLAPPGAGDSTPETPFTPTEAPSTEASGETPDEGSGENAEGLVAIAEVAVGGGVILEEEGIVITQPAQGEWRGFSSACTHQGCTVASVADNTINCDCHGSKFSIEDGSVVNPPAPQPLEQRAVAVEDGWVVLA